MNAVRIALCICTCRRPEGLARTLGEVAKLAWDGDLQVIVVENDARQEGLRVAKDMASSYRFTLTPLYQPQSGISAARNMAVHRALSDGAHFIAMIDDDEWPTPGWLAEMMRVQQENDADIVCGPIEPDFAVAPPAWAVKGDLFRLSAFPKSGNVIFRADTLRNHRGLWFDTSLGLTGGEDTKLFKQLVAAGARFSPAEEAVVYEAVPQKRLRLGFIARRALRNGCVNGRLERTLPGGMGFVRRVLRAGEKLGYAANHLFWSALHPWRLARALNDGAEAAGRVLAEFGYAYPFYAAAEVSAPAVHVEPARLRVRCHDNWGDFDDALIYATEGGTGVYGDVAFVRDDSRRPDWIGIFNSPKGRPLRFEHSPNRVFFAIGEPPEDFLKPLHIGQGNGTYVLTPDEALCATASAERCYVLSPCMARAWSVHRTLEELHRTRIEAKPRRLSWVTSNLTVIDGHRYRMRFLERLKGALDFDLYGRGFSPILDKWHALAPYRYSIAFENTSAPYYFTEKLMDCFVAETMPLYYGSKAITQFFPAESMILIDPEDPDIVAKIDEAVRSDLWLRNRDAILEAKRRVLEDYNLFARLARFVTGASEPPLPAERMRITPVSIKWD